MLIDIECKLTLDVVWDWMLFNKKNWTVKDIVQQDILFDRRKYLTKDVIELGKLFDRKHYLREDIVWKRNSINGNDCFD